MVALYSSATRLSFFKFLSVLRRRDKAIGLVSGSSGFQGTATRYLPFSYSTESFTLFNASLSSSVSTSLSSRSVPNFSISQNLFRLLSTSQQDPFLSFHRGSRVNMQGTDNVGSCSQRIVFIGRTNTAPTEWSEPGDRSTIFPSKINMGIIVEFRVINSNQKVDNSIVCWLGKTALGQVKPFVLILAPIHNSVIAGDFLRAHFDADFFRKLPIDTFNFDLSWH